jgi:hypothetical protein
MNSIDRLKQKEEKDESTDEKTHNTVTGAEPDLQRRCSTRDRTETHWTRTGD